MPLSLPVFCVVCCFVFLSCSTPFPCYFLRPHPDRYLWYVYLSHSFGIVLRFKILCLIPLIVFPFSEWNQICLTVGPIYLNLREWDQQWGFCTVFLYNDRFWRGWRFRSILVLFRIFYLSVFSDFLSLRLVCNFRFWLDFYVTIRVLYLDF